VNIRIIEYIESYTAIISAYRIEILAFISESLPTSGRMVSSGPVTHEHCEFNLSTACPVLSGHWLVTAERMPELPS
jgi:hypothetical protein